MNLGKLLAAGKSIIGGSREVSYRVSDRVYLPKFISPKNPFTPVSSPEPPPQDVPGPAKKSSAPDGKKTQKLPRLSKFRWRPLTRGSRFKLFSFWRRSAARTQQKIQGPMQAELSLDRVKVVHNDLSDADVEIVPIKSRTGSPAPDPAEPVLTPANGADSWSRLGAKIFGIKTV